MDPLTPASIGSPWLWLGFIAFVLGMLALDLGVFHRKAHVVSTREALYWSAAWLGLGLAFNAGLYFFYGSERALEFFTGYLIEKALAVDNIFVFVVVFAAFGVPLAYQHRVLFWGVLGALLMRAAFIFAGSSLLERFHFTLYVFGLLLVATGIKLLVQRDAKVHPEKSLLVRGFSKLVPVSQKLDGDRFFTKVNGVRHATPLLLALIAIEASDLIFAVDSIPAIFAVTRDPFIVFTSNIFAILGLRSLYFLLAHIIERFSYLKVGLALVLVFVGMKMLLADVFKLPIAVSLLVIVAILGGSVLVSLLKGREGGSSARRGRERSEAGA